MNDHQHLPLETIETVDIDKQAGIEMENTSKILGMVRIYGNEPHTFVGIRSEDGIEYAVYPPSQERELRRLQGHLIEFTVIFPDEGDGSLVLRGGTVTPVSWRLIQ